MRGPHLRPLPTLGAWLALTFSALSILLTVVLALVIEGTASRDLAGSIGSHLAELANQTATRLDRGMFERYREMQLTAQRLARMRDWGAIQSELDAAKGTYRYYAWMGVADERGVVQAASGGVLKGADVSLQPWFLWGSRGGEIIDVHPALLPAGASGSEAVNGSRVFDIAFPVHGEGVAAGVVGAQVSWDWARDVQQVIFGLGLRQRVDALIVASDGTVLLGPPGVQGERLQLESLRRAALDRDGYLIEDWPDGGRYLVGYSSARGFLNTPSLGWKVLVRQDLTSAYEPLRRLRMRVFVGGLALALLFSVLGWIAARGVTAPLKAITAAAHRLEQGSEVHVRPSNAYREVQVLGAALNAMIARLQGKSQELADLNAQLEERVQQRTAELREAFERVQSNEHRIETIIESAQDPFIGADIQGRITDWNSRAEAVFGWAREEVLGRRLSEVAVPPRFASNVELRLEQFRRSGDVSLLERPSELMMMDRQGREFPVELRIGLVSTGEQRFFTAFVHDISRRKEVERLKDEFITTVSHELRTPLTAIYGSLDLLASGMAGELPPDAKHLLAISHESTERLVRLINDMLDLEKIASGNIEYKMAPQPLRPLLEQAIRDTAAYFEGLHVPARLVPGDDARANVDADRIVQVCVNLLSNAAKFSPAGAEVEVLLRVQDARARVSVVDRGPGVPLAFRGRIFERFAQADASDRRARGGTGLGLAICRSIVEAHGGVIAFDTEPGVRTEFYFELPLA